MLTVKNEHDAEDNTMMDASAFGEEKSLKSECCLVQIYPTAIVDGMVLMEKNRIVAGRDEESDLWLGDSSVSRNHAEFRSVPSGYEVYDLDSTNGTLVNGERVQRQQLKCGDIVKLGSYMFKFLSAGSIEAVYYETVYSAMTIDALTGAFNKSYLLDNLQREIARSFRHDRPLAVIMTDIDKFKSVNDTYGHLVGDEVLKQVGSRLIAICRQDDIFARYGGEEFSLVLSETNEKEALEIAERCREAISNQPFETAAGPLEITSSFGVAMQAGRSVTPNDLIGEADELLYQAKKAGRNRVMGPKAKLD